MCGGCLGENAAIKYALAVFRWYFDKESTLFGECQYLGYFMERFEQCYKMTRSPLKNLNPSDSVDFAKVFGSKGPKREHVGVIDALRTTINKGKKTE